MADPTSESQRFSTDSPSRAAPSSAKRQAPPETANTALYPRLSSEDNQNNYTVNSVWLADRSFLKLRNVEVYYHLPATLFNNSRFIKNAKFYVRGIDLLCLDHIKRADPECYGADYPVTRSVSLGVVLGF